jgi:hypothetical protein
MGGFSVCDSCNKKLPPDECYAISKRGATIPSGPNDVYHFRCRECATDFLQRKITVTEDVLAACQRVALDWLKREGRI